MFEEVFWEISQASLSPIIIVYPFTIWDKRIQRGTATFTKV